MSNSRLFSDTLRRAGFTWDDWSGEIGAWVRHEVDGTITKLGRVGRQYVAVSMTDGDVPAVRREAHGRTRHGALAGLLEPAAEALADSIYRNGKPRV